MKLRYTILFIISFMVITLGFVGQPVQAQSTKEPNGFENVTLWVYPEYDDPRFLMMLEGQITGAEPPAQVRFLVPQTAEMYSAGSKDSQGKYTGGPPARKASTIPGWDEISYTLTTKTFRVEYYDDIIKGSPDKNVAYDFRWLYPISNLRIVVQQPKEASNFVVAPFGSKSVENGFTVYTYNKSGLTTDPSMQPLHFDISYTKADQAPSTNAPISAVDPGTSGSGAPVGGSNMVPMLSMVIVVVVIAAFIVTTILKKNTRHRTRYAAAHRPSGNNKTRRRFQEEVRSSGSARPAVLNFSSVSEGGRQKSPVNNFCDQCGKPISKSHKFCMNCGRKVGFQN